MADLTVTAANVKANGTDTKLRIVQAGEAVTQGQPCYLKSTDAKYYKGDANASESTAEARGIAITPASTDGYFVLAESGPVDVGATLTVGEVYVVSATAGGIAPVGDLTTGDYVTILGVASTASSLALDIAASGTVKP